MNKVANKHHDRQVHPLVSFCWSCSVFSWQQQQFEPFKHYCKCQHRLFYIQKGEVLFSTQSCKTWRPWGYFCIFGSLKTLLYIDIDIEFKNCFHLVVDCKTRYDWILTLEITSTLTVNLLDVVNHVIYSLSLALQLISHSWSLQPLKRVWRTWGIFSAAGQFLYMKEQACVTGRADGKPELRGKAVLLYNVQWKFPKGQLLSLLVTHWVLFFLVLLDWSLAFVKGLSKMFSELKSSGNPFNKLICISPLGPSEHIVLELGL